MPAAASTAIELVVGKDIVLRLPRGFEEADLRRVLAVVGMQSAAVKAASDAKYRSDANLLANELIGQMWTGNRTGSGRL